MSLKEKLAGWRLRSKLKKRTRVKDFININDAVSVGIIWREGDGDAYKLLQEELQKRKIKHEAICYSDISRDITFSRNDFSLFGKPKSPKIISFLARRFDILIDISQVECIELDIIRALSFSTFKVGCVKEANEYLDFNLVLKKGNTAKFLAEQMIHYLDVINKKE